MGVWIFGSFMLLTVLLIPLTMVFFGRRFANHPPNQISPLFGYRTSMSMKNRDTWDFAHRYFGRLWLRVGLVLIPLSVLPLLAVWGRDEDTIAWTGVVICFVQLIPMAFPLFPTERALKRTFDKDGRRR